MPSRILSTSILLLSSFTSNLPGPFLGASRAPSWAQEAAEAQIVPEVAKARADVAREAVEIILEQKQKLRVLKDKHLKLAEKNIAAATKKGERPAMTAGPSG